ncbi:MAG: hypothetical protein PHH59_06505 [Methylovulum sp.]|uniref:hypothetical protein n=1 Tax=Methylovulum sp. TaxID=1916980 RepID=UPI00261AB508|nr:hypothetical protein [Methylovulum sp.]MDD2723657.1 hypothetical protein [Methylovulum sp.]MDD5123850.1 hypothetical protein [Methylovulum sp.]
MECVCVVGMHRSGTSCLTGIMQRFGVELGAVFTENPHNKRGNRENAEVMELNDEVLAYNGGAWNQPVEVKHWTEAHRQQRQAVINRIKSEAQGFWGFKDPRTLLTLPFWLEPGFTPRYIGTFRHPLRVMASLNARNSIPVDEGIHLWFEYNERLLALWTAQPFPLIDFDLPDDLYISMVTNGLIHVLGPQYSHQAEYAKEFFCKSLRSQLGVDTDGTVLPSEVAQLYGQIKDCQRSFTFEL